jgi:hypothetical protein
MGSEKRGGNIAPLRLRVHNAKPDVIIVTETRIEDRGYDGKGVFRGYKSLQNSSTGRRAGGVMVFVKRDFNVINGTVRNSRDGHYTIAAYEYKGERYIIGGIYGNCTNSDGISAEIFQTYTEWHRELKMRLGNIYSIIGGDFNLKLDLSNNFKPRTTAILRDFMLEFDLKDAGEESKKPTWRRPHLPKSKSRIDYIIYSGVIHKNSLTTTWGRMDHAEILGEFSIGEKKEYRPLLKDWVLATEEFLEQAPKIIQDVLLDHDTHYKYRSYIDRERYINNRRPREYENELDVTDKNEGIFNSHILMLIINRLVALQRRVQGDVIRRGKKTLQQINQDIGDAYLEYDTLAEGDEREAEVKEKILDLKAKLRDYTDNVEQAKRIRIENFYTNNMGKNKAASFLHCLKSTWEFCDANEFFPCR